MYLPDFEYLAPSSVDETLETLAELGPRAKVLAGGTDLLVAMKQGGPAPEVLVSIKNLDELRGIRYEEDRGVVVGARTTHNEIMNSPVLHERYLSISEAAHQMAANQVRNQGTIGGNFVNAVPSADLPPIFIALGASVTLKSVRGERTVPLEDFFTAPRKSVLAEDEILTEVVVPDQETTGSTYYKFGLRRAGALAVVGVAVAVTADNGHIRNPRICLGAVAPTPIRSTEAEDIVADKEWDDDLLNQAGWAASQQCNPITDIRGCDLYRRDMIHVFTHRGLRRALAEGHV